MLKITITKRLCPWTSLHFSTGSCRTSTSLNLLKWFRNVVLPLPIFPSTITVKGLLALVCFLPSMVLKNDFTGLGESKKDKTNRQERRCTNEPHCTDEWQKDLRAKITAETGPDKTQISRRINTCGNSNCENKSRFLLCYSIPLKKDFRIQCNKALFQLMRLLISERVTYKRN